MKSIYYYLLFVFIVSLSCSSNTTENLQTKEVVSNKNVILKIDSNLTHRIFEAEHGAFENTKVGIADIIYIDSVCSESPLYVKSDTFKIAVAYFKNDTLNVLITTKSAGFGKNSIVFKVYRNELISLGYQYIDHCTGTIDTLVKPDRAEIILQSNHYKIGDTLNGYIFFHRNTDYKEFRFQGSSVGYFSTIIQDSIHLGMKKPK